MEMSMKVTIIGGGNMGGAMALGMAAGSFLTAGDICVSDKNQEALARLTQANGGIRTAQDNAKAVCGADLVILAVKPWLLEEVAAEIKGHLDYTRQRVASIVARVDFSELHRMLDNGSGVSPVLYRIMPNTAISVGESMVFIAADRAQQAELDELTAIFGELGGVTVIGEELMTAATSLASCGIAFALRYMRDAMQGGTELGFSPEAARTVVMQTVRGALAVLEANDTDPQTEIDKVTTPGGATLKGLAAMDEAGFTEAVLSGLFKSR